MVHKEHKVLLALDHRAQQVMMALKALQVMTELRAHKVLLEPVHKELLVLMELRE